MGRRVKNPVALPPPTKPNQTCFLLGNLGGIYKEGDRGGEHVKVFKKGGATSGKGNFNL